MTGFKVICSLSVSVGLYIYCFGDRDIKNIVEMFVAAPT